MQAKNHFIFECSVNGHTQAKMGVQPSLGSVGVDRVFMASMMSLNDAGPD